MRTLFCSHVNGMPLPPAPQQTLISKTGGGTAAICPTPKASLGGKYRGGELPAGQEGAEPPTAPRVTYIGVPA